jgi:hypothetical protein
MTMSRTVRIRTERVLAQKVDEHGNITELTQPVSEYEEEELVTNESHNIHNIPPEEGDTEMDRFNENPIENDSCEGVPALDVPTHNAGQQDDEPETTYCNVEGDLVPTLEVPHYNIARKIAKRERAVENETDDDGVPNLYTPSYKVPKKGAR